MKPIGLENEHVKSSDIEKFDTNGDTNGGRLPQCPGDAAQDSRDNPPQLLSCLYTFSPSTEGI